jgi:hypothetical protein
MPIHVFAATRRRWLTLTCLSAAALAAPLTTSAQTALAPTTPAASLSHHAAYTMRRESLDQRIASLHAALKITPAEEADWAKVADVMRRNDSEMQKLVADRQAHVPYDLRTYQTFTQAHVDGLKDLIASFETLYTAMPADQKSIADHVFAKYGRDRVPGRSGAQAHS